MKRHGSHSRSCSGTNCIYKSGSMQRSVQQLIDTGSRIDNLYFGKYLPLRERKLLDKLIRTRAIYDDVRTQLLSASGSSDLTKNGHRSKSEDDSTERSSAVVKIVNLVDRGQIGTPNTSKLSTTCSCCSCGSLKRLRLDKHPRIHTHSVPYEEINKYAIEAKKRGRARRKRLSTKVSTKLRAVRFKAKRVRSAPCLCTLKFSRTFRRQSKTRLNKKDSKEIATSMPEVPKKYVKIERKTFKCLCTLKLRKHAAKAIGQRKRRKTASVTSITYKDMSRKGFQIRKDSIMLFREKLNKKKTNKDWECDPDACVPEECEPEECYFKIKSKRAGRSQKNKFTRSKSSGTDLPRSDISISTKKKVSHVNVGKKVKKVNMKCMCPTTLTSSGTDKGGHTRKMKYVNKIPRNTKENIRIQTETKVTKKKKSSRVQKYRVSNTSKVISKSTLPYSLEREQSPDMAEELQYKTEELESHPSKQVVRIGSNFSFNIEFYKQNLAAPNFKEPNILEDQSSESFYKAPHKIREERSPDRKSMPISNISSQLKSLQFIPDAQRGHGLKRCMCTLKIPRRQQKRSRASKNTMTTLYRQNVDIVGQMRETQTKPFKFQDTRAIYVTPPLTSNTRSLLSYECEPFFCTAGECEPVECEKRIRVRDRKKYIANGSNTNFKIKKSNSISTAHHLPTSKRKVQSSTPKHKITKHHTSKLERSVPSLHQPRQGVRIGSSFSFNIEFSKERYGDEPETQETEKRSRENIKKHFRQQGIKAHRPQLRHTTSQTMKTEKSRQTQKFDYPTNILKETGTVTPLGNKHTCLCPSVVMRHQSVAAEKDIAKYYRDQATISPYQCKPGASDPRECKEIIRMRNARYRNQYVNTRHKRQKRPHIHEKDVIVTPSKPEKQVVRIGSSFSFNIEFYKERPPVGEVRPFEVSHKQKRKRMSQGQLHKNVELKETGMQNFKRHELHKAMGTDSQRYESRISGIKRCFCTSKLHKNRKRITQDNIATSIPDRVSRIQSSANIILKPKYCKAVVCEPEECCKEIDAKKHYRKGLRHLQIHTDSNSLESVSNINQTPYNARYRNQSKYTAQTPKTYKAQEQIRHRPISFQQNPRQAVRIGSVLDFKIDYSKQKGARKNKIKHKEGLVKSKENVKTKKEIKTEKLRVKPPKKEHKTCNLGPKILNAMKDVVEKIKKVKLKRSKSQYTMVRVKKPKPGEVKPVTAAFFQVIRDVDYKPMNLYNSSYRNHAFHKEKNNMEESQLKVGKYSSKQHFHRSCVLERDFYNGIVGEAYSSYRISRVKNDLHLTRTLEKANKILDSRMNSSSEISTHCKSYYGYNIESKKYNHMESVQVNTSVQNFYLDSPQLKKSPYHQNFCVFNVLMPYIGGNKHASSHTYGKCDSIANLQLSKSPEIDQIARNSITMYKEMESKGKYKNKQSVQSTEIKHPSTKKSVNNKSSQFIDRNEASKYQVSSRQYFSLESNISFRTELYKQNKSNKNKLRHVQQASDHDKHIQQSTKFWNHDDGGHLDFHSASPKKKTETGANKRKRDIIQGHYKLIKHHIRTLCPKCEKNKASILKTEIKVDTCEPNTYTGNKESKSVKDIKNRQKQSKSREIYKGNEELSVRSDDIKKGIHNDKRCTRNLEYQLYTCIPDRCNVMKYKSPSITKSKPKGDTEIGSFYEIETPSSLKKCVCIEKHYSMQEKGAVTKQNKINRSINVKPKKGKSRSGSQIEHHTMHNDIELVLPYSKRKSKKKYQANTKSNKISNWGKNQDQGNGKNNGEKDSKSNKIKKIKLIKKKDKRNNVTEVSNVVNVTDQQMTKDLKASKSTKGRTKILKTGRNKLILDSKCENPQCNYYEGDTEIKYRTQTGHEENIKPETVTSFRTINQRICSDTAINKKPHLGNTKHKINKKRNTKKKSKQTMKPDVASDYQGFYPCICSDTVINENVYSTKNENNGLCPMCKTCADSKKNPLLAMLQEKSTLLMEKINSVLSTLKNKRSNNAVTPITESKPLFEMLVNKDDMSIINKEDIIAKVKKSSEERRPFMSPSFKILLHKSDASIINSDEMQKKLTKTEVSDELTENFKARKSLKRCANFKTEQKTNNNYRGLYPCICSDSMKNQTNNSGDINNNDKLCPMCKHCGDSKNNRLQEISTLFMDKMNEIFAKIKSKCENTEPSNETTIRTRPLFEMLVNKDDMSIINKEHIIAKVESSSDERTQYSVTPRFQMILERNTANIMNPDEIRKKLTKIDRKDDNLFKTEQNEYLMDSQGEDPRCSHCLEKNIKKTNRCQKKNKLNIEPETIANYQGLYPCICSDSAFKQVYSGAGDKLCKYIKKNPLLATFHANSTLLMDKMNKLVTKIKSQCEDVVPSTDTIDCAETKPLFEMVVNKDDMSILNKEDIVRKVKSFSDGQKNHATQHNLKMLIDKSDASFMNSGEIRNKLMTDGLRNKISSNKINDEIFMKSKAEDTKSKRQAYSFKIHGKNCNCCYCASKRQKKIAQTVKPHKKHSLFRIASFIYCKNGPLRPCVCGSEDCKIALKEEREKRTEMERLAKQKSCVCGSKICRDVISEKNKLTTKSKLTKKSKRKKKTNKTRAKNKKKKALRKKPDLTAIGPLLCGKIDFNEFKDRIQGKEESEESKIERLENEKLERARKEKLKRKKLYAKEDAKRREERIKNDKIAMEEIKSFKDIPDFLLCAESIVDIGKLGFKTAAGVLRTTFRALSDPKATWDGLKAMAIDPEHAARSIKESVAGSAVGGTASRIKQRIGSMSMTEGFVAKMETNPVTNYMVHCADKDPKKRMKGKRLREPLDFECSLFMGSLRKRPHLWVYYMCPWFYPHCISLLGVWKQFTDIILFLLAVAVWSPCILAMEACRALMCCFLCTG